MALRKKKVTKRAEEPKAENKIVLEEPKQKEIPSRDLVKELVGKVIDRRKLKTNPDSIVVKTVAIDKAKDCLIINDDYMMDYAHAWKALDE